MTRWTENNTEDFTAGELAAMNEAQAALEAAHPEADDSNIADALSNSYYHGITVADLVAAATSRIG